MKTLPNHIVFKEAESALRNGKPVTIRVVGKSMEPFLIDNKDIVRIVPSCPNKLHRGDIVLFKINNVYCLHRIISIKGNRIILCGDGISQSKEKIRLENVIGILDSVICQSGDVILCKSKAWVIKSHIWMALLPIRKYLLYAYHKLYQL